MVKSASVRETKIQITATTAAYQRYKNNRPRRDRRNLATGVAMRSIAVSASWLRKRLILPNVAPSLVTRSFENVDWASVRECHPNTALRLRGH